MARPHHHPTSVILTKVRIQSHKSNPQPRTRIETAHELTSTSPRPNNPNRSRPNHARCRTRRPRLADMSHDQTTTPKAGAQLGNVADDRRTSLLQPVRLDPRARRWGTYPIQIATSSPQAVAPRTHVRPSHRKIPAKPNVPYLFHQNKENTWCLTR
jgi:hypothetical protein